MPREKWRCPDRPPEQITPPRTGGETVLVPDANLTAARPVDPEPITRFEQERASVSRLRKGVGPRGQPDEHLLQQITSVRFPTREAQQKGVQRSGVLVVEPGEFRAWVGHRWNRSL